VGVTRLDANRLRQAKLSYTARHVATEFPATNLAGIGLLNKPPEPGDLVLAEVLSIGHLKALEAPTGRRAELHVGDEIIACYADRYAPDVFEAEVPADLSACHLVAAGGIVGSVTARHDAVGTPTALAPAGLLTTRDGEVLNLRRWALPELPPTDPAPPVIAVAGTAMNSGKTTTATMLIRGLSKAGLRVGAAKLTGTGSGRDIWRMRDAGATLALDFTDAGYPSTYRVKGDEVLSIARLLLHALAGARVDAIVIEIADGLIQQETRALLELPEFADLVDTTLFASYDALGASAGVQRLALAGYQVTAVSGMLTCSPLMRAEASDITGLPVLTPDELATPGIATSVARLGAAVGSLPAGGGAMLASPASP
jgi:hypothetical protein